MKPYLIIKFAMTRDGYLADASDKRLILSNDKDFAEVEHMRESVDAILVGATTIRKDNPRLILKSGKKLTKITITSSGNLDLKSNFFTMGDSEKIVYTTPAVVKQLKEKIPNVTIVAFDIFSLQTLLKDLEKRGIKRLLVEGGATIITEFLNENLVDELQVSIAPRTLGDIHAPRITKEQLETALQMVSTKHLDEMEILTYKKQQVSNVAMQQWIQYVIALSEKCPPSETAFSVGAALVDNNNNLIADGYSRETGTHMHAEEVIFEKIKNKHFDFSKMTLYTSLEPCNTRLSKEKGCVDAIITYGINHIVYAATEPPIFVEGHGAERLKKEGKEVTQLSEYKNAVIDKQAPTIQNTWKKIH